MMQPEPTSVGTIDLEIGRRLHTLRTEARLSRSQVAQAMMRQFADPPHRRSIEVVIAHIEHGRRPMTLGFAVVLCHAIGIDVAELTPDCLGDPT